MTLHSRLEIEPDTFNLKSQGWYLLVDLRVCRAEVWVCATVTSLEAILSLSLHLIYIFKCFNRQIAQFSAQSSRELHRNILFSGVGLNCQMCHLCTFVEPGCWRRISRKHFERVMARDKSKNEIVKCTKRAEVQRHTMCTHASHEIPTTWDVPIQSVSE